MYKTVKKSVAAGILAGISFCTSAQTPFQIKGNLKDTSRNGEKVTLSYHNGEKSVYTSVVITNGTFAFEGMIADPARASLSMPTSKKMREKERWIMSEKREFFIEGGAITVEGYPLAKAVIKAPGKAQKDYLALEKKLKPFEERERKSYVDMLEAVVSKDTVANKNFKALNERTKQQIDSVEVAYLKANPASHVSLGLLNKRVYAKSLAEDKENLKAQYTKLATPLKQTVVGKKLGALIETAFKLGPGQPAADFVLNDTLGNPVRLSDFKGKYVLVDFWASWCIPCRAENPTLMKAWDKYRNKNFAVLGISLERAGDRKSWVTAINKDQLTYPQVAPLTKEESTMITTLYGIQSIPMNYLIDPQGKVVAVHLRGEALLKKLEELL